VDKLHVLIIGNSVSLSPREGVPGYVDLVASDERWSIERIIRRGATIGEMECDIVACLSANRPDVMVLQIGIVECAPRPLNQRERQWLSRLKNERLRNFIIRLIHILRRRIIRARGLNQRMPLDEFRGCVSRILKQYGGPVAIIPMPAVSSLVERRSPGYNDQVARYNDVLKAAVASKDYLDILRISSDDNYDDVNGIHLSGGAHKTIAATLTCWLEGLASSHDSRQTSSALV
jgi:hypothetical protein